MNLPDLIEKAIEYHQNRTSQLIFHKSLEEMAYGDKYKSFTKYEYDNLIEICGKNDRGDTIFIFFNYVKTYAGKMNVYNHYELNIYLNNLFNFGMVNFFIEKHVLYKDLGIKIEEGMTKYIRDMVETTCFEEKLPEILSNLDKEKFNELINKEFKTFFNEHFNYEVLKQSMCTRENVIDAIDNSELKETCSLFNSYYLKKLLCFYSSNSNEFLKFRKKRIIIFKEIKKQQDAGTQTYIPVLSYIISKLRKPRPPKPIYDNEQYFLWFLNKKHIALINGTNIDIDTVYDNIIDEISCKLEKYK